MARAKYITLHVTFRLPPGATEAMAIDYVSAAVQHWAGNLQPHGVDGGGYNPDVLGDPMSDLDASTVDVELAKA